MIYNQCSVWHRNGPIHNPLLIRIFLKAIFLHKIQSVFTGSKLAIETLEQVVKCSKLTYKETRTTPVVFIVNFEHILHCFSVSIVNLKRVFLFSKIGNHSVLFFPSNIWFEIFFASKLNT